MPVEWTSLLAAPLAPEEGIVNVSCRTNHNTEQGEAPLLPCVFFRILHGLFTSTTFGHIEHVYSEEEYSERVNSEHVYSEQKYSEREYSERVNSEREYSEHVRPLA